MQTEKAKSSHFDRTRGDKNQIFPTLVYVATSTQSDGVKIQILCRFQKCKQKVLPLLLLSNEKSPFTPPKDEKNLPLGG